MRVGSLASVSFLVCTSIVIVVKSIVVVVDVCTCGIQTAACDVEGLRDHSVVIRTCTAGVGPSSINMVSISKPALGYLPLQVIQLHLCLNLSICLILVLLLLLLLHHHHIRSICSCS